MASTRARGVAPLPVVILIVFIGFLVPSVHAQLLADTSLTWRSYGSSGTTRARIYATPAEEDRARVVVLTELAENRGPSTVTDAQHIAELVGRRYGFDPSSAYWVFHWGAHSFSGAEADDRELFLRATFHRTSTGRLSSPYWKVIRRDALRELTDRQFR